MVRIKHMCLSNVSFGECGCNRGLLEMWQTFLRTRIALLADWMLIGCTSSRGPNSSSFTSLRVKILLETMPGAGLSTESLFCLEFVKSATLARYLGIYVFRNPFKINVFWWQRFSWWIAVRANSVKIPLSRSFSSRCLFQPFFQMGYFRERINTHKTAVAITCHACVRSVGTSPY